MICFFDCETTGLPKDWKAPITDLENWPRVISLAWICTNIGGAELTRGNYLIKPEGWTMPTEKFWVENAFSQENSILNGKPITEVLKFFIKDLNDSTIIVSHNMSFDFNVVGAEMIRANLKASKVLHKICTKEESTDYCKIPGNYGKYKWPKLSELHFHLFGKDFEGAHDALADVIACKDCFFELMKAGVINIHKQIA